MTPGLIELNITMHKIIAHWSRIPPFQRSLNMRVFIRQNKQAKNGKKPEKQAGATDLQVVFLRNRIRAAR